MQHPASSLPANNAPSPTKNGTAKPAASGEVPIEDRVSEYLRRRGIYMSHPAARREGSAVLLRRPAESALLKRRGQTQRKGSEV